MHVYELKFQTDNSFCNYDTPDIQVSKEVERVLNEYAEEYADALNEKNPAFRVKQLQWSISGKDAYPNAKVTLYTEAALDGWTERELEHWMDRCLQAGDGRHEDYGLSSTINNVPWVVYRALEDLRLPDMPEEASCICATMEPMEEKGELGKDLALTDADLDFVKAIQEKSIQ